VAAIRVADGTIVGAHGNIAERETADALVDLAIATHGRLDVLCNNDWVMDSMQGVGQMEDEIWRRVTGINLDGPMFTSRRAVQHMRRQGSGSIINIASIGGLQGGAAGAAYTVSRHGLIGLTRNTAWMYAREGICCNAICPGATATNIGETMPPDRLDPFGAARASEYAELIPATLERGEIVDMALCLACDEARSINGAVITADAGWTAA
jgi:NAD(P)-dependent dehydrogenase (short-subunit alcohol dehydrogenase family)